MIKNRIVYILSIIVLLLLLLVYENEITYIALYTALLLPVISLIIFLIAKRKFTIYENLERYEIVKGENTSYNLNIKNNSFLPCTSINIKFLEIPYLSTSTSEHLFHLGVRKNHNISFELKSEHRGIYQIGIEGIVIYDFLGLFSFKQKHLKKLELVVLPRVLDIFPITLKKASDGVEQNHDYRLEEDYSVISDLRKYVPTDGYKKIHWKASAKKNELISKNFGTTKKNSVTLILDNTPLSIEEEDYILETFVSILNYVSLLDFEVSIVSLNDNKISNGDFNFLYDKVSKIFFDLKDFDKRLDNFVKIQSDIDNLIVVTRDLTDEIILKLRLMKGNILVYYVDKFTNIEWENAKHIGGLLYDFR